METVLGIDDWAGNVITDYPLLKKSGVDFSYIRLGQGLGYGIGQTGGKGDYLFEKHWKAHKDVGMLRGAYWVYDPWIDVNDQIKWVIDHYPTDGELPLSIDAELTGMLSNDRLINNIGTIWATLSAKYKEVHRFSNCIIYSGAWWWNDHMYKWVDGKKVFPSWSKDAPFWWAYYLLKKDPRIQTNWEFLLSRYIPRDSWCPSPPGEAPPKIWQFSGDKFLLPGITGPIDLNLVSKSWYDKFAEIYVPPVIPPEEPQEEVEVKLVVQRVVTVRPIPQTNSADLGRRNAGDVVVVLEIKILNSASVWIRDIRGWSAVVHGGVVYMKEMT